jgi:hypothetical protein
MEKFEYPRLEQGFGTSEKIALYSPNLTLQPTPLYPAL